MPASSHPPPPKCPLNCRTLLCAGLEHPGPTPDSTSFEVCGSPYPVLCAPCSLGKHQCGGGGEGEGTPPEYWLPADPLNLHHD